jgi:hypothetical protein
MAFDFGAARWKSPGKRLREGIAMANYLQPPNLVLAKHREGERAQSGTAERPLKALSRIVRRP